jgi:pilus assembly protein CpaF
MDTHEDWLGPLEPILQDEHVMEIMVNGPEHIFFERHGKLEKVEQTFRDEAHVMQIIERIAAPMGHKVDESHPILDLRLPDGSLVHIVIPPIAINGPSITIRKNPKNLMTLERLLEYGSFSAEMAEFIRACILARLNIVIAGGTGSGKTTILNIFAQFIPDEERIILLQNAADLQLHKSNLVVLETRPPNLEGKGEIHMRHLMVSAMKMRPERIIMSEARGGEVWDLFQAMNTGHDGSMFTLHATSPRDTLGRLEIMATQADPTLPLLAIRDNMASAIDLIVQQNRLRDGSRRIEKITEVTGMQGDVIVMQDLFEFTQTDVRDGKIQGIFRATGRIPRFMDRIIEAGINLPAQMFMGSHGFPPTPPTPPDALLRWSQPPHPPVPPAPPMPPKPRR